ncbi:uncharacterized protein [Dendropsophus ebraccatus]|uniref:uncharacterized protein n=1 Tax=Dendropsophus ebraccatus TaxID=150705 RepID=UPI0038313CE9
MDLGLSLASYFVLVITVLYILNVLKTWNQNAVPNFPPGPRCLPLIGNLHQMDLNKLHVSFSELAKKYGPVFSVQMGWKKMVVLAGYETVKEALVNRAEDFGERGILRIFQKVDKGMGLVYTNGEIWKIMRRFTINTLRDFGMGKSTIEEKIADECTYLTKYIASFKGKPFDNSMILNTAVGNIIVAILLGNRMDYDDPQFRRLIRLTTENIRLFGSPMVSLFNIHPFFGFLPGGQREVKKNIKELFEFIRRTFVEHLKNLDENDQKSFIDTYLVRQKEETGNSQAYFSNENLTRLIRSLFAAGMETTSTTLCWGLLIMVKYPKIQEKVQEEISKVIGLAQPMYSHRAQMPFTNAVIHEIQRFFDILPLNVGHKTAKDVTFKGYFIPKGTYIVPLLTSVLKDKTQFEKPDEFYPEHFLDSEGNFIKKDAFMPFSVGRRACAGETLARMELFIFFTSLLQRFTFCLPSGVTDVDLTPIVGVVCTPKPQMVCAVPPKGIVSLTVLPKNTAMKKEWFQNALQEQLLPTVQEQFADQQCLFQHDGAPCHKAKMITKWLREQNIQILGPCPGISPDINPIEKLWSVIKRRVDKQKPTNFDKMQALIVTRLPCCQIPTYTSAPVTAMDLGFSLASYFVLVMTLLYILNIWKSWNKNDVTNFPPGPRGLPLIGNLHQMDLRKLDVTFLELAKKYGPVYSVQMGMQKMVVLTGYETVKEALVNHAEDFGERGVIGIFKTLDKGMGLVFSNGENWKIMRRFTISTLRDFGMGKSTIEEKIADECTYLTTYFASFKGKPFDNSMILNAAVANIIVAILLGIRMDYDDPQFKRLLSLTNEYIRLLATPMVSLVNVFPFLYIFPGSHKTVKRNVREIFDFIQRTFVEHLKNLDENDQRSLIDVFLVKQKEEEGNSQLYFHNENLTVLVRNLFAAGMETTSTTLRWGLLLMIKYPKIQEKVQEEISRVIGSAQPMYSHRGQMPFTNAVIHEIQRLSDIIPLNLGHETTKDVTFKGYFIPKGTYIVPSLTSVLKDKTQFEKPDEFYPQHFLDSKGNFIKKDAFMPFSAGRRACAGETLARMELFIFFTSLLQKFTFCLPPGVTDVDLTPVAGITNAPKLHMICAVSRF